MKEKTKTKIIIFEVILVFFLSLPVFFNNYSFIFLIVSDSMNPVIHKNDIVLVKNIDNNYLDKIIAYYNPLRSSVMVHRIIGSNEKYYTTKGDNVSMIDFYQVPESRIIGEVVFILKTSELFK